MDSMDSLFGCDFWAKHTKAVSVWTLFIPLHLLWRCSLENVLKRLGSVRSPQLTLGRICHFQSDHVNKSLKKNNWIKMELKWIKEAFGAFLCLGLVVAESHSSTLQSQSQSQESCSSTSRRSVESCRFPPRCTLTWRDDVISQSKVYKCMILLHDVISNVISTTNYCTILTLSKYEKYDGRLVAKHPSSKMWPPSKWSKAPATAKPSNMHPPRKCWYAGYSRMSRGKVRLQNMLEACRHCRHWTKLIEGEKELVTWRSKVRDLEHLVPVHTMQPVSRPPPIWSATRTTT